MLLIKKQKIVNIGDFYKKFRFTGLFRSLSWKQVGLIFVALLMLVPIFSMVYPANAAIGYKSLSSTYSTTQVASINVNAPSGLAAGDLMIAAVSNRGAKTVSAAGWTLVQQDTTGPNNTDAALSTFYRRFAAGETSYTFSISAADYISVGIVAYSGVAATNPIMASAVQFNYISTTTHTAPSVTTTAPNAMIASFYSISVGSATVTAGSGMTKKIDQVGLANKVVSQDAIQPIAGSSGTKIMTSSAAAKSVGVAIALSPITANLIQSAYRWFNNSDTTPGNSSTYSIGWASEDTNTAIQATSLVKNPDDTYVVAATISDGYTDKILLVKHNADGSVIWSISWGGSAGTYTIADSITRTVDGGYVVVGQTEDDGSMMIVKFTDSGTVAWANTWQASPVSSFYPGSSMSVATLSDGNIIASVPYSIDDYSAYFVKINSNTGALMWSRAYSNGESIIIEDIVATSDGGFLALVYDELTYDSYGLVKHTAAGAVSWAYIHNNSGSTGALYPQAVIQASDGGYAVVGDYDGGSMFISKHTSTGGISWSRSMSVPYGAGLDIAQTSDGGYIVSGGGFMSGSNISKLSSTGTLQWSKEFTEATSLVSVAATADGGALAISQTMPGIHTNRYDSSGNIAGCPISICRDLSVTMLNSSPLFSNLSLSETSIPSNYTLASRNLNSTVLEDSIIADNPPAPISISTPLAAQNTAAQAPTGSSIFRLRTLQHVTGGALDYGNSFKLQYAERGVDGVCDTSFSNETYADVSSSTPIAFGDNTIAMSGIDIAASPDDPVHSGHTTVLQSYNESNPISSTNSVAVGQDGLFDFALRNNSAPPGAAYCFRMVNQDDSPLSAYSQIPELTIGPPPVLSINFVDATDTEISNPTFAFDPRSTTTTTHQTSTSTFGTATQKIQVFNSLATNGWNVTLSPTDGATALWKRTDNLAFYDLNDSGTNATDSAIDTDTYGGQLSVNPTASNIASACSTTGTSSGSTSNFLEGTADAITLMSATSAVAMSCYWDLTNITLTQTIPAAQPTGNYTIGMTVTVVQL